jgi:hypothetical protein
MLDQAALTPTWIGAPIGQISRVSGATQKMGKPGSSNEVG